MVSDKPNQRGSEGGSGPTQKKDKTLFISQSSDIFGFWCSCSPPQVDGKVGEVSGLESVSDDSHLNGVAAFPTTEDAKIIY